MTSPFQRRCEAIATCALEAVELAGVENREACAALASALHDPHSAGGCFFVTGAARTGKSTCVRLAATAAGAKVRSWEQGSTPAHRRSAHVGIDAQMADPGAAPSVLLVDNLHLLQLNDKSAVRGVVRTARAMASAASARPRGAFRELLVVTLDPAALETRAEKQLRSVRAPEWLQLRPATEGETFEWLTSAARPGSESETDSVRAAAAAAAGGGGVDAALNALLGRSCASDEELDREEAEAPSLYSAVPDFPTSSLARGGVCMSARDSRTLADADVASALFRAYQEANGMRTMDVASAVQHLAHATAAKTKKIYRL